MIEVLIAVALVVLGMLAVMKIQGRLQESEFESYQRTQALLLLNDMVHRLESNRNNADDYVTASAVGANCVAPAAGAPRQLVDMFQWCSALQGAGETQSGGNVGAMIDGRGCVEATVGPGVREYMVTVTWQGFTPLTAPPASISCAANAYDQADVGCVDDRCRRFVSTVVRMADLEAL
tara:strand:- start:13887 stop:14420 length:534 start_codon:yes stop_codon:yes gene_type:complete